MKTFREYEEFTLTTAVYPEIGNNSAYPAMGLSGESGEALEVVKKYLRVNDDDPRAGDLKHDPSSRGKALNEIGDALWYLTNFARELGSSLEEVAQMNVTKLGHRKEIGTLIGEGDDR